MCDFPLHVSCCLRQFYLVIEEDDDQGKPLSVQSDLADAMVLLWQLSCAVINA